MKAIVKRAYFDRLGLHKIGAIVEVEDIEKMSNLVEPLNEGKAEQEENTETKKVARPAKKVTKKPAKKKG